MDFIGDIVKGQKVTTKEEYIVMEVDSRTHLIKLQNTISKDIITVTDWWFHNMKSRGSEIYIDERKI